MEAPKASTPSGIWPLPADTTAPAFARAILQDFLDSADQLLELPDPIAPETMADAALIASELVTNAIVHGAAPQALSLEITQGHLLIEVTNHLLEPPPSPEPPADEFRPGGRGLPLITSLATSSSQTTQGQTRITRATLDLALPAQPS